MRFTLIVLFLMTNFLAKGQIITISKIRFDGFYKTEAEIDKHEHDTTYEYLRFYPSGIVINVSSDGTPNDLKAWFNIGEANISVGNYHISRKKIFFSTNEYNNTVIYQGKIKSQYCLDLRWKSLGNGNKGYEKFFFVTVRDLK